MKEAAIAFGLFMESDLPLCFAATAVVFIVALLIEDKKLMGHFFRGIRRGPGGEK